MYRLLTTYRCNQALHRTDRLRFRTQRSTDRSIIDFRLPWILRLVPTVLNLSDVMCTHQPTPELKPDRPVISVASQRRMSLIASQFYAWLDFKYRLQPQLSYGVIDPAERSTNINLRSSDYRSTPRRNFHQFAAA